MRRVLLGVVLVLAGLPASAAVEYEFHQVTRSDLENVPSTDFTGRAVIDGDRSRVEFLTGNAYTPGTYLISTNGNRLMTYVDPAKKTYLEVNAASVANALGATKLTVTNKRVNESDMDDHPVIAGLPTDHYRLSLAYDITLSLGSLTLTQAVSTIEDKYVTTAFGDVTEAFLASSALKTGNPELDELTEFENRRVKGFALKQVVTTTTTNSRPQVPGSALKMSRTITTTREITVTSISSRPNVPTAVFLVPVGFKKADTSKDDTQKTPLHMLSLEPPASK